MKLAIALRTFLGSLSLVFGLLLLALSAGMYFAHSDEGARESGLFGVFVASGFIAAGGFYYGLGRRTARQAALVRAAARVTVSYGRARMPALAATLGVSEDRARALLVDALTRDLLRGRFDPDTGEFLTEAGEAERKAWATCVYCGSPLGAEPGKKGRCDACGARHVAT